MAFSRQSAFDGYDAGMERVTMTLALGSQRESHVRGKCRSILNEPTHTSRLLDTALATSPPLEDPHHFLYTICRPAY